MKKTLSAIVVAALGWVAFDRVTLALELRGKADALGAARATYAGAAFAACHAAWLAYDEARDTESEDAARAAPADDATRSRARDAANTAIQSVAALAAFIAVTMHLNRNTPSA